MAQKEIVVNLRIADQGVRETFNRVNAALVNVRQELTDNNKALRENAKEQKLVTAAQLAGQLSTEQAAVASQRLGQSRNALLLANATLKSAEAGLAAQHREAKNEVGGLTDAHLRFRDKMADATLEAIKQSGILTQLGTRMEFLQTEQARLNQEQQEGAAISAKYRADLAAQLSQEKITQEQYRQLIEQRAAAEKVAADEHLQTLKKLREEEAQTAASVEKLNTKFDALGRELKEGRITVDQYRQGVAGIEASVNNVGGAVSKGVADLKSYALGFVGVVAVAQGVVNVVKDIIDIQAKFGAALSKVSALGGEYKTRIDELGDAARELGPKFGLGVTESVGAIEALAKAGVSTADILGGGLEAALTLSTAGSIELGAAAETAASAMTQFGLSGSQLNVVADALVNGANNAQGGVDQLRQALSQSGLVAAQFGLDLTDTVGALTTFASAGLLGSDAGTSFKAALLRLAKPTEDAATVMAKYSISAFDLQGRFVGIEALAGQFQERLSGLTDEQRASALATIFGTDAIRVGNILYEKGAQGIKEYTDKVKEQGTAAEQANELNNNLRGDLNKLGASYESLVTKGNVVSDSLRGLTKGLTLFLDQVARSKSLFDLGKAFSPSGLALASMQAEAMDALAAATKNAREEKEALDKAGESKFALKEGENARKAASDIGLFNATANESAKDEAARLVTIGGQRADIAAKIEKERAERDLLNASDIAGIKAKDDAIRQLEKQAQALDGTGKATEVNTEKNKAQAGSIAAIREEISKVQELQGQSRSSIQFQAYQDQIDALNASLDILTGKLASDVIVPEATPLTPIGERTPVEVDTTAQDQFQADLEAQDAFQEFSIASLEDYLNQKFELGQEFTDADIQLLQDINAAQFDQFQKEQDILAAKAGVLGAFGQILEGFAEKGTALAKVGFALQKAAAIADVIIKTQTTISGAIAGATANLAVAAGGPPAIAAYAAPTIAAAKINAAAAIGVITATAIKGFDVGGYTAPGHRLKPAGIVHAGEWVAPQWQVNDPKYAGLIEYLEKERARKGSGGDPFDGWERGGTVRGTALVNARAPEPSGGTLLALEQLAESRSVNFAPVVSVSEINRVQQRVEVLEQISKG